MPRGGLVPIAALAILLAGCAGGAAPAPAAPAPSRVGVVRVPEVMSPAGLEGVIGAPAATLTRRFGEPRLDLAEGDARKLQFAGGTCVLDVYLYPLQVGAEPTAAHVEARQRQGGADVDRGACIREVERQ